jgi:hypothetical protein
LALVLVASFLLTLNFTACDESGGATDGDDDAGVAGDAPADLTDT